MATAEILINCYNGEKYLKETLESVAAQTYQDWEIVFVDNCSTDRTAEIAKAFGPKLRYYRTPSFMRLCEARAWARPYFSAKYLAILDADDLMRPQKLEKQIAALEQNPEAGFCYSNSLFFSDTTSHVYYTKAQPSGWIFEQQLASYSISMETLLLRRSVLEKHNLFFDPRYNISADFELMIKVCYFTKAIYLDEVLAQWRFGHANESTKQMESFPRETELLIEDLKTYVPDLEVKFAKPLKILRSRIENMYGLSEWKKGNFIEARKRFKTALRIRKRYVVPWLLTFLTNYNVYSKYRQTWTRV